MTVWMVILLLLLLFLLCIVFEGIFYLLQMLRLVHFLSADGWMGLMCLGIRIPGSSHIIFMCAFIFHQTDDEMRGGLVTTNIPPVASFLSVCR